VDGEARHHFIEKAEAGWYFEPENPRELANVIQSIVAKPDDIKSAGKNGRIYVSQHFNRDQIAASLYKRLTSLS
jgi:glycosyltransferase involved in cell wall biosynthesis